MRLNVKSILPIIAAAITLIMAVSCGHRPTRDALERADALIDEHADSALAVLQTIDTTRLSGRRDYALYGLLMTQALVKLHHPVTSDSLIAPAARYFAASSDRHHAMRALYYHGVVKYDNEQYPAAMVQFFRARDIATDLGDHFWAGLACRGISDIFNQSYNKSEELLYAEKEYKHFIESGRTIYIRYAMLDLARAYCSAGKYAQSRAVLKNLKDTAVAVNDDYLLYNTMQLMARCSYADGNFDDAIRLYDTVCSMSEACADDSLYLALSYIGTGDLKSAENIASITTADNMNLDLYYKYQYYVKSEKWREATSMGRLCDSVAAMIYQDRACQNLQSVVADDLVNANREVKADLRETRNSVTIVSGGALFVITLLSIYSLYRFHKHRREIEAKVIMAEQLEEQLSMSVGKHKSSQARMKSLLSSNYTIIEQLCSVVAQPSSTKSYDQKIASLVTRLIRDIAINGEKVQELIDSANALYDNIYDDFVRDLPNVKSNDCHLFLYSIHGFTTIEIMFLLNEEKATTIYSRKRHLKDKIKLLSKEKSDRYLSAFKANDCGSE